MAQKSISTSLWVRATPESWLKDTTSRVGQKLFASRGPFRATAATTTTKSGEITMS